MNKIKDKTVQALFDSYPQEARRKLLYLRRLILETAQESKEIEEIEETVKWGQPSYLAKGASTVRLGWSEAKPDQCAVYFHCQTKLVDTFREIYGEVFNLEGNRAIIFHESDAVPVEELKHCILLALTYHRRKKLPLLGV